MVIHFHSFRRDDMRAADEPGGPNADKSDLPARLSPQTGDVADLFVVLVEDIIREHPLELGVRRCPLFNMFCNIWCHFIFTPFSIWVLNLWTRWWPLSSDSEW